MSSDRNDLDDGPSEEASGQEDNYEGNKTGLSETYDMRDFCPGITIEAQDFDGKWYPAKVADVDWTENEILVHFENRNTKFDEWIPMDSSRLRSLPKPLVQVPKETLKFVKGEEVMAMWSPYQKYPATIQAVLSNDRYDVLFYDGFLKRLKAHKISKSDGGIVRSEVRNFSDIGTKEERRERKRKINVKELFHINKRSKKKGLVHSKSQDMKTYPVNKSRAKSSAIKKSLQVPNDKNIVVDTDMSSSKDIDMKPQVPTPNSYLARSLVDTIPAAVKVKYIDGRTEMWSKQLYQRSEGRTAGKLDIVILNPQGRKFRSRNEIMKYCEENGIIYEHDAFDFSAKGRPKSKSVVQGYPGLSGKLGPISEDTTDKLSLKKFRRKSQVDESLSGSSNAQIRPVPSDANTFTDDKVFIGDVEVVVQNGKFICPVQVCGKHFRRENLLHMHVKHYHPEFSKYLDYTPSVTDLAYMRTVGNLENNEPSPVGPRKTVVGPEKVEKQPIKVEKCGKSLNLVMEGNKDARKTPHKLFESAGEHKNVSKLLPLATLSPSTMLHESSTDCSPSDHTTVSDSFDYVQNSTTDNMVHTPVLENKGVFQDPSLERTSDKTKELVSSNNISKSIKYYKQRRGSRIRDFSRSSHKSGRQQQLQGQPSVPLQSSQVVEEQSNTNLSSQLISSSGKISKPQLSIANDVLGDEITDAVNEGAAVVESTPFGNKTQEDIANRKPGKDPKCAYILLENDLRKRTMIEERKLNMKTGYSASSKENVVSENNSGKRKRCDDRRDRSKMKKKVIFESLVSTRWIGPDSEENQNRKFSSNAARRTREKSGKLSRYNNYLGKKGYNGMGMRTKVGSSVSDEKSVAFYDLSSDLDQTEVTEDSKSPFTVDNEKVEKLRRNEIINCVCGVTEEDGLMIQCDLCLCWQHGHCMEILRDADVPEKYICSICKNPFRGRSSMRYIHDQEWLKEGTLPCLSFRSKREDLIEQRRTILKRSYDLSGSISLLSQVIHSLRVKVNIAEKKDHPKLWLWAKKWLEKKPTRLIEDVKEEKPVETSVACVKEEGLLDEEQQLPKVPEPEAPIDSAECRLNLLDHLIHYQTLVDARLSCIESLVAELESMQDDVVDDEGPDRYPRTKATIQMILRDLNTMKKIAAI